MAFRMLIQAQLKNELTQYQVWMICHSYVNLAD